MITGISKSLKGGKKKHLHPSALTTFLSGEEALLSWSGPRVECLRWETENRAESSSQGPGWARSCVVAAQCYWDQRRGPGSRLQEAKGRRSLHLP